MTRFWSTILVLACLSAAPAAAQQAVPPTRHELLDSTHTVINTATGARYRRDTEYADSIRGVVREFTLAGQLVHQSHYENLRTRQLDGIAESWWPNGQLSAHEEYAHGKRLGDMRLYYQNAQLKRRARYDESGASTGECFGPEGQPVAFFEYEIMPRYSRGDGGFMAIVQAIASNVKYPRDALKAKAEGRVFVKFVVDKLGKVADIELVKGVFPSLDQAAMQAVRELRAFTPAQQDGEVVAVSFTVPITFRVQ
ncbi:TonB family protein [Hymenobacter sp. UYCo722]|uniref:TonB family protein n=1 Tax=Hymenobacter sp. UYCo722 TaxID=3156335 RepID=UPI0033972F8C